MSNLPFMQFFPADWIRDTQILSLEAQGAWMKILCALHFASDRGRETLGTRRWKQYLGYPDDDRAIILLSELVYVATIECRDGEGNTCNLEDSVEITIISNRMIRDEIQRIEVLERKRRYEDHRPTRTRRKPDKKTTRRDQRSEIRDQRSVREDNTSHLKPNEAHKWPSPELLIQKYNLETPESLPAVEKITPARLKKARDYLKIFPDESFWTEAFQEIGKSEFLQGLKNNSGHESFKANFDWLLSKGKDGTENIVKTFEGRYKNGH